MWRVHVAFGVERVVEAPISHRRARHSGGEGALRGLQNGHQRHVAAIGPALDANAVCVHEGLGFQPVNANQLIAHFRAACLAIDFVFKGFAAIGAAAIVEAEHDIALTGIELIAHALPVSGDELGMWAAIHFHQDGVFLTRVKSWRLLDGIVEVHAVLGFQRAVFWHGVVCEIGRVGVSVIEGVLFDPRDQYAVSPVKPGLRRLRRARRRADKGLAVGGHDNVPAFTRLGDTRRVSGIIRDGIQMTL